MKLDDKNTIAILLRVTEENAVSRTIRLINHFYLSFFLSFFLSFSYSCMQMKNVIERRPCISYPLLLSIL